MSNNFPAPAGSSVTAPAAVDDVYAGEPAAAPAARLVDNRTAVSALNGIELSRVRRMIFPP